MRNVLHMEVRDIACHPVAILLAWNHKRDGRTNLGYSRGFPAQYNRKVSFVAIREVLNEQIASVRHIHGKRFGFQLNLCLAS